MKAPTVKIDPVMEAIAKCLFGIESVPAEHRARMIKRAAKEGAEAARKECEAIVPDELAEDDDDSPGLWCSYCAGTGRFLGRTPEEPCPLGCKPTYKEKQVTELTPALPPQDPR
jgi:hypothetical protein